MVMLQSEYCLRKGTITSVRSGNCGSDLSIGKQNDGLRPGVIGEEPKYKRYSSLKYISNLNGPAKCVSSVAAKTVKKYPKQSVIFINRIASRCEREMGFVTGSLVVMNPSEEGRSVWADVNFKKRIQLLRGV